MRSEVAVRVMLSKVEETIDEDTPDDEAQVVIQETLIWVLENYVSDDRILDYLPS